MRSKTKSNVFASDSSKRCDVELKCLFGTSGPLRLAGDWDIKYDVWYSTILWFYWRIGPS